ncbi:family 43 glycosylhydrolase [Microlunatus sp. Y2014]|uniref:family 43 glycosylhydrolase n=1 Tax=Microlunatus sp. Y2014 TaxID=3418488 RepID=UPI003DA711EC
MFGAPAGMGSPEVGDIEVLVHEDRLHLFHLTLPNHDLVQHAVSDDGLTWTQVAHALRVGDPGEVDDDQIWTMGVCSHDGRFVMLYTALSRAENGMVQRVAFAESDDLMTWSKRPGVVVESDARWYEAARVDGNNVSWRDPKPIFLDDSWLVLVSARSGDGDFLRRGAVGGFVTRDFQRFEVVPPLFTPGQFWYLECPQIFRIGDWWYLTAGVMEDLSQRYWISRSAQGPWHVPSDGGRLAPRGHYAAKVVDWRDATLLYCWHQVPTGRLDWDARNPTGRAVPAPIELVQQTDGSLEVASFSGWGALASPGRDFTVRAEPAAGVYSTATQEVGTNFRLKGRLTLGPVSGGIVFRQKSNSGGYFIEMTKGSTVVQLRKTLATRDVVRGRPWFTSTVLQQGDLRLPLADEAIAINLTINGPYVEFSVNDQVVLATFTAERTDGELGVWSQGGPVECVATIESLTEAGGWS